MSSSRVLCIFLTLNIINDFISVGILDMLSCFVRLFASFFFPLYLNHKLYFILLKNDIISSN
jgi:hypothetical protein